MHAHDDPVGVARAPGLGEVLLQPGTLAGGRFDLVLADVVMPGMDGAALAGRIGALRPGLPVLLMTGYADSAALPPELWDRVLAKPFRAAELEGRIAALGAGR